MRTVHGNILDKTYGIICHQVNCQLVMGAGLAKQIRAKYPRVFTQYQEVMGKVAPQKRLGRVQIIEVIRAKLYVANMFAQYNYLPRSVAHTDYVALSMCLRQMKRWRNNIMGKDFPIYIPYGMGAGLAGGNWPRIQASIRDIVPDAVIVKLPEAFNK